MLNISTHPFVKIGVSSYSDELMIDVKEIIATLQKRKQNEKKEPLIVGMVDVQQEAAKQVLEELRRLTREGEIKYHQTLNGHAFSVYGV